MEPEHHIQASLKGLLPEPPRAFRFTAWGVCLTLPAAALSISLTQILIAVTLIVFAVEWRRRGRGVPHVLEGPGHIEILAAGGLLFSWLFLSLAAHLYLAAEPGRVFRMAASRELRNLPLYGFAWVTLVAAMNRDNRRLILNSFFAFAVILVASGVVALFSEFRLARLVMGAGHVISARNRPQHPAFTWDALRVFRPIGFMNTRLTYAGILALCIPPILYSAWAARGWMRVSAALLSFGSIVVLAVNATRSAWIGLSAPAGLAVLNAVLHGSRTARIASIMLVGLVVVGLSAALTQPVVRSAGLFAIRSEVLRYTDAERPILWAASAELAADHPLFGVGPGTFPEVQRRWRARFTERNPMTFYWVNNAPDGHAHNDLLHQAATGGILAAALFALLFYLIIRRSLDPELSGMARALLMGCASLFPAGLFQCYFQDAEVVVVFWILLGMAGAMAPRRDEPGSPQATDPESIHRRSAL